MKILVSVVRNDDEFENPYLVIFPVYILSLLDLHTEHTNHEYVKKRCIDFV